MKDQTVVTPSANSPSESSDEQVLSTRPLSSSEKLLRDKFYERFVSQNDQMDKLGQQLITLELAIPGLYATVLKLLQGETAVLPDNNWLYFTFLCWFLALLLTLISLIPRTWQVDPTILKDDPAGRGEVLGLEAFFYQSARYKRNLLIPACLFFWVGITSAALILF